VLCVVSWILFYNIIMFLFALVVVGLGAVLLVALAVLFYL
jgi:hypothetical protein